MGEFQKDFLLHTAAEAGRLAGLCARGGGGGGADGSAPAPGQAAGHGSLLLEPADDVTSGVIALVRTLRFPCLYLSILAAFLLSSPSGLGCKDEGLVT